VRNASGAFIKNDDSSFFSVPQLARSMSSLPGYLTNGNTPQGVFRMYGFEKSKIAFIGPTENIQLSLPVEASRRHFFKDSLLLDEAWDTRDYKAVLPKTWATYFPLYEAYYAGLAGRTEIIAHGTTIDPSFYKGKSYFPHTPTEGCLCTREIWSEADGSRMESNQQKLVDAVKKAGGADGYLLVIELDAQPKPVTLPDVLPYIRKKTH
jgi:hypothetical protein